MSCAVRNTVSQLIAWSTQSVFGDVLINRGTFALYRAHIIREIIPAYLDETFLGRPVRLGDDSALTLFARAHGRTVQQVTAFCLPMYPENLSHHFRQWLRWARGGSWPSSARVVGYIGVLMISWAYAVSPRSLCVRREGEGPLVRLGGMLIYPAGIIWTSIVLRPIRLYGIVTWFNQGWVTRTSGVEVTATHDRAPQATQWD
jgi:hyaluronan synthase